MPVVRRIVGLHVVLDEVLCLTDDLRVERGRHGLQNDVGRVLESGDVVGVAQKMTGPNEIESEGPSKPHLSSDYASRFLFLALPSARRQLWLRSQSSFSSRPRGRARPPPRTRTPTCCRPRPRSPASRATRPPSSRYSRRSSWTTSSNGCFARDLGGGGASSSAARGAWRGGPALEQGWAHCLLLSSKARARARVARLSRKTFQVRPLTAPCRFLLTDAESSDDFYQPLGRTPPSSRSDPQQPRLFCRSPTLFRTTSARRRNS